MQPLKTTSDVRTGSTETGYNSLAGTLDVNATVEDVSPQPVILPPAGLTRVSSVDRLPESPGYEPITMADLWKIADRAHDVVSAARRHLPTGDPGKDPLFKVGDELLAVEFYTCNLRECAQ